MGNAFIKTHWIAYLIFLHFLCHSFKIVLTALLLSVFSFLSIVCRCWPLYTDPLLYLRSLNAGILDRI